MRILTIKEKEFQVDDEDYEWLNDLGSWHLVGTHRNYAALSECKRYMGQVIYLHRLIMLAEYGHEVIGMDVDHVDRNPLNCQKFNMRLVTEQQNTWNRTSRKDQKKDTLSSSKFKGVTKQIWRNVKNEVRISKSWSTYVNKKFIGSYLTEEEAARMYDKKILELRGEFAELNFPNED